MYLSLSITLLLTTLTPLSLSAPIPEKALTSSTYNPSNPNLSFPPQNRKPNPSHPTTKKATHEKRHGESESVPINKDTRSPISYASYGTYNLPSYAPYRHYGSYNTYGGGGGVAEAHERGGAEGVVKVKGNDGEMEMEMEAKEKGGLV